MSEELPFGHACNRGPCYLRYWAARLAKSACRANVSMIGREADIEQDILIGVWRNWKHYSPEKSKPQTFISRLARQAVFRAVGKAVKNREFPESSYSQDGESSVSIDSEVIDPEMEWTLTEELEDRQTGVPTETVATVAYTTKSMF